MMIGDWDEAIEVSSNVLMKDPENLIAMKVILYHSLAREGNVD